MVRGEFGKGLAHQKRSEEVQRQADADVVQAHPVLQELEEANQQHGREREVVQAVKPRENLNGKEHRRRVRKGRAEDSELLNHNKEKQILLRNHFC